MKRFFLFLILSACNLFALTQIYAQKNMELTASEVTQRMMPGWNLGNTLEAGKSWEGVTTFSNKGGLGSETAWQQTKTTQAVIDYVKSQGFRSVRIPCAWVWGHMADANNYTIDATWMARVKEIVDYCIKDDLYVLLNDHWDGGWLDDNLTATGAQKEKNKAVLAAIWTQIANEFLDYDDHLVFAGQNEPPIEKQSDIASLVEYQQTFIDAVRATGGNNEKRLLVVQGPSTDVEKTCNWLADKMPTDPSGKLAVEIHFYYPWNFWGMTEDANWGNMFYYWGKDNHFSGSKHNPNWGEEEQMTSLADLLKTKFIDKGIPVINGEYGVIWRTVTGVNESQEKHNASIKYYYKFMNQLCMERGIVPMAWDTNSTGTNQMTIINRQNLTIYNSFMMDGIHEAMEAVGIPITSISSVEKLEAESATYANCKLIDDGKYSGGQALELSDTKAKITFTYNAANAGKYTIYVCYDGLYGAKVVNLEVNGNTTAVQGTDQLEELNVGNFILNAGDNTITITPNWTWFRIDYIRIASTTDELSFDIAQAPVDANAANCAKTLYSFLYDNFGKKTISGIMTGDMTSANGNVTQHDDVKAVYQASGKYPALIGFDFMNATGLHASEAWYKEYTDAAVSLAKDTYRRGGLPAFTWHWRDPSRKTGDFYCKIDNKDACTMRITDAMNADGSWNTTSDLYANIISDIDAVADYFLALQEAGVACIFRPLHEASGAWFWWGASGPEPYVKLYQLIFDEMVSVKGVHNVIWVWNPCSTDDAVWNPGEAYHDVISIDIYNNANDHSSNYAAFDNLKTLSGGKKLIALSENGPIPDIDKEFEEDAVWSWWMPWYQTWDGKFVDKTSKEEWTKCMTDSRVITLEDLSAGWDSFVGIKSIKTNTSNYGLYDLQGRRLNVAPSKGIYIQNGRKRIIQ